MSASLKPAPFAAEARPPAVSFRHVENWLFDLDNTLYEADGRLMTLVESRIRDFVQQELNLEPDAAFALQKSYYREHGTTLFGLMQNHGVEPERFLTYVNDVAVDSLAPNPELCAALARLPGRRFVFTNNCGRYAERILKQLGAGEFFEDIFDVRALRFMPKPAPAAYQTILDRTGLAGRTTAMFDDLAVNLAPAHALGMTTILIKKSGQISPSLSHIHHETDHLSDFLHAIEVSAP
jgi:putative hydrolase of the HAD superfamily